MKLSITGKKYTVSQNDKKVTQLPVKPKVNNQIQLGSKIQSNPINYLKKDQTRPKVQVKKQKVQKKQQQTASSIKQKQQYKKIVENVEDQPKIQQNMQLKVIQTSVPQHTKTFEVVVRYNHYKDPFIVQNQILRFSFIDQKYGFNLVFKGNYLPILKLYRQTDQIEPQTQGSAQCYSWKVQQGKQYQLFIQEDEQEQSKYEKKAYKAPQTLKRCSCKKNVRVDMLTAQMKKLQLEQLGSQKHKQLLQQRDLQQILFS